MPDIYSYELIAAFSEEGCSLCRVCASAEQHWLESFWREGRQDPETRLSFYAAGGLCHRHAWMLHGQVSASKAGFAIADIYGTLADRDANLLQGFVSSLRRGRRHRPLARSERCPACVADQDTLERQIYFFAHALEEEPVRQAYLKSDGLCFLHLASVANDPTANNAMIRFLIQNWCERLAAVREQLSEYDRRRDHRYAAEPPGREQDSWTDVIRHYVGPRLSR